MSCLFSDDIAVGAEACDTLAIGVTGYSHSLACTTSVCTGGGEEEKGKRKRWWEKKNKPAHNYVSFFFFSPSHATHRLGDFRTKIAAGPRLHKYT